MTANLVPYEDVFCTSCGDDLVLETAGVSVNIICTSCGEVASKMTTSCRGPHCGKRVFFGGKSGRVPIATHTGASHFYDCVDAARFRKQPKEKKAPKTKPEPVARQAGLL